MRKCVLLAAAMAACVPTSISAQTPNPTPPPAQTRVQPPYPAPARWFVNIHGGAQVGSQDLNSAADFSLYEEPARFETQQTTNGGGLLDIGGAGRLYRNYGLGISYAQFESTNDASFSGSLPHPEFFDQPRAFSGTAPADHKERVVHIQALWFIPFTDKIEFTVGAGPSFFTVEQGLARGIVFSENPPEYTAVTIDSVDLVTVKESGVGFNLGANMFYTITRRIGASAMLRYTRGSLTFSLGEGQTADGKAGGFQFGAGVAVRFW